MLKIFKLKGVVISIGIIALIIITFGIAFAFYSYTTSIATNNSVLSGNITFSYSDSTNGIDIVNSLPVSDEAGKLLSLTNDADGVIQGYFDFVVSANVSNDVVLDYEIYMTPSDTNSLAGNYVKVYLTNQADVAYTGYDATVPIFTELVSSTVDSTSKTLYTNTFTNEDSSHDYRLRMWLSSNYLPTSTSLYFKSKVHVRTIYE